MRPISRPTSPRSATCFTAARRWCCGPARRRKCPRSASSPASTESRWCRRAAIPAWSAARPRINGEVVVSLRRLDKIREIDPASNTMTCEAGVVLQIAQAARGRSRSPVPAVARRGRKLHHRRQSLHQCRRHRCAGVWRGARDGARAGSGAGRRPDPERAVEAEKGQYRLRSAQPLHRRRRHARHHHRGDAKTVSEAARGGDRLCRPQIAGGGAEAVVDLAERGGRQPHQLRTAGRHRGRFQPASRHRHPRSADEQASLVRADGVVVARATMPAPRWNRSSPRAWRKASSTTP